jgi:7,8-dihydropterin-6-yl-methyl-4-(beta-D-ribofuranosyl)aminobenzene 5'-phosphate synthase
MDFLDAVGKKTIIGHPRIFEPRFAVYKLGANEVKLPIGIPWSREDIEAAGAEFKLSSTPLEIIPGVWFSGEIPMRNDFESTDPNLYIGSEDNMAPDPFPDDAALFVLTDRGMTVVAGCAHRGIVNTMALARDIFPQKPFYAVIGGFHLGNASAERIDKTVKAFNNYGVKMIATGHCTGLPAAFKLACELGDKCQFLWAGRKLEI